ncbi:MAG: hypothetical protein ACTSVI_12185 [Promethearchaeota archaeon]
MEPDKRSNRPPFDNLRFLLMFATILGVIVLLLIFHSLLKIDWIIYVIMIVSVTLLLSKRARRFRKRY